MKQSDFIDYFWSNLPLSAVSFVFRSVGSASLRHLTQNKSMPLPSGLGDWSSIEIFWTMLHYANVTINCYKKDTAPPERHVLILLVFYKDIAPMEHFNILQFILLSL
ncbi:MAG TPA: hypothetical protein DD740_06225 [Chryseobacterium sp.]|nr:hypothetical protein [Chryseobacterium sp.]